MDNEKVFTDHEFELWVVYNKETGIPMAAFNDKREACFLAVKLDPQLQQLAVVSVPLFIKL